MGKHADIQLADLWSDNSKCICIETPLAEILSFDLMYH